MKTILLALLLTTGLFMISCSKEYTCECIIVQDLGDGTPSTSNSSSTFSESSQKKAKEKCEQTVTQSMGPISQTMTCTLK